MNKITVEDDFENNNDIEISNSVVLEYVNEALLHPCIFYQPSIEICLNIIKRWSTIHSNIIIVINSFTESIFPGCCGGALVEKIVYDVESILKKKKQRVLFYNDLVAGESGCFLLSFDQFIVTPPPGGSVIFLDIPYSLIDHKSRISEFKHKFAISSNPVDFLHFIENGHLFVIKFWNQAKSILYRNIFNDSKLIIHGDNKPFRLIISLKKWATYLSTSTLTMYKINT